MKRICFLPRVKADRLPEYRVRHKHVWPEMQQALRETGWNNYSLFLTEDGLLVGYLETGDFEAAMKALAEREINKRWQTEMAEFFDLQGTHADRAMQPLEEIFHLD